MAEEKEPLEYSAEVTKVYNIVGLQPGMMRFSHPTFGELNFATMTLQQADLLHDKELKYLVKKEAPKKATRNKDG